MAETATRLTDQALPGQDLHGQELVGDDLGERDMELVRLLAEGLPIDRIARRLCISERTVRRRTRALCDRLGVLTPVQAVVWAARRGML